MNGLYEKILIYKQGAVTDYLGKTRELVTALFLSYGFIKTKSPFPHVYLQEKKLEKPVD